MGNVADNLINVIDDMETEIKAVADVGNVHDHDRHVPEWDEFFKAFTHRDTKGNQWAVRGWTISRESTTDNREVFPHSWTRVHNLVVRGYHSIEDEQVRKGHNTEHIFQKLIEDVCDKLAIWAKSTTAKYKLFAGPPTVRTIDVRELGSHLVHYCEISIAATTRLVESGGTWIVQA